MRIRHFITMALAGAIWSCALAGEPLAINVTQCREMARLFISSTSTMEFLTIIPISPISPIMAMKVNGVPVNSRAGVMPMKTKGRHSRINQYGAS